jgi:hypothetical protein
MGHGIDLVILPTECFLVGVDRSYWFGFELQSYCSASLGFVGHEQRDLVVATTEFGDFARN